MIIIAYYTSCVTLLFLYAYAAKFLFQKYKLYKQVRTTLHFKLESYQFSEVSNLPIQLPVRPNSMADIVMRAYEKLGSMVGKI